MKKQILGLVLSGVFLSTLQASDCFEAEKGAMAIGQQIRQVAQDMGWKIGKMKSISVGGVIKGKKALYPDGDMEVCLEEKDGDLHFIMKSSSDDADKAKWHFLKSSKKGWL